MKYFFRNSDIVFIDLDFQKNVAQFRLGNSEFQEIEILRITNTPQRKVLIPDIALILEYYIDESGKQTVNLYENERKLQSSETVTKNTKTFALLIGIYSVISFLLIVGVQILLIIKKTKPVGSLGLLFTTTLSVLLSASCIFLFLTNKPIWAKAVFVFLSIIAISGFFDFLTSNSNFTSLVFTGVKIVISIYAFRIIGQTKKISILSKKMKEPKN